MVRTKLPIVRYFRFARCPIRSCGQTYSGSEDRGKASPRYRSFVPIRADDALGTRHLRSWHISADRRPRRHHRLCHSQSMQRIVGCPSPHLLHSCVNCIYNIYPGYFCRTFITYLCLDFVRVRYFVQIIYHASTYTFSCY